MKYVLLAVAIAAAPAFALPFADYAGCVALVKTRPAEALRAAGDWGDEGGASAGHCAALALTRLKRYPEAAAKLEQLARAPHIGDFRQRAMLWDQAGNAWLLDGKADKAAADFSTALAQVPNDTDMHADRARARAMMRDWAGADADLSAALAQDPNRADLLVLRSSARQALNLMNEAAADVVRALVVYPDYPPALVERGRMKLAAGDVNGARRDWQRVAKGRGAAAAAAKKYLKDLPPDKNPISAK
jgi:tetratricopeptide (TPR) repeat protein